MPTATADAIQAALVVATMWATGIGLGLVVRPERIVSSLRRPGLVGRVLLLDLALVPLVMWLAVNAFVSDEGYATGLLLVAFAAAGPVGIKLAHVAGGDATFAIAIVVVLELANVLVVPLWSGVLGIAGSTSVVVEIFRTLLVLIVLPLGVGLALAGRWGVRAGVRAARLQRAANVGIVATVVFIAARNVGLIDDALGSGMAIAAGLTIGFALVAGWLMGGPRRVTRVSTSLVTGVRANAASLAIASTAYGDRPEVAVGVIVAGAISALLPGLAAAGLALSARTGQPGTPGSSGSSTA